MAVLAPARQSIRVSFRSRHLWLVQILGNPILFLLFVLWLILPVEHTWQVLLNGLLIVALVVSAIVLQAGTMNYFRDAHVEGSAKIRPSFRRAFRHLFTTVILLAIVYAIWVLLQKAMAHSEVFPAYIRSTLPVWIRRHFSLPTVESLFRWILFVAWWIVTPGILLPFFSSTADKGFRGFGSAGWTAWKAAISSGSYWLMLVVAAVIGAIATTKLMGWTPDFRYSTLRQEGVSLAWRLLASYALGLTAWMSTCSLIASFRLPSQRAGGNAGL